MDSWGLLPNELIYKNLQGIEELDCGFEQSKGIPRFGEYQSVHDGHPTSDDTCLTIYFASLFNNNNHVIFRAGPLVSNIR
jgi:hypothetical protein